MIRIKVRQAQRRHSVGLVMVDHLHIVRPEDGDVRAGATYAVGQISLAHKRLAKEFGVPVLLLAQLNRAADSRDDHRPVLTDLRQSGDIEQDADAVMFVYRPEYYLPKAAPERSASETGEKYQMRVNEWHDAKQRLAGVAEVILAKVREGEACVVPMDFDGATTAFSEVSHGQG
jgi:replicative DNA helicase